MSAEHYRNDAAIHGDGFGPERAGDQVARMALEVTTPFAIGVTGKWGAGKTSVLRRAFVTLGGKPVETEVLLGGDRKQDTGSEEWDSWIYRNRPDLGWPKELTGQAERSLCIWYSPWQHQAADNPLVPLLLEMRAQFTTRIRLKKAAGKRAKELNRRGGLAALALLERVIDGAASVAMARPVSLARGTTEAVRTAWQEAAPVRPEPSLDDGQRFHLLFEDAVEALLDGLRTGDKQQARGRVIIFIDDLDRCEGEVVVELLEAIKLYLGSRFCVFVLAMDENAVLGALHQRWPERSEDDNREYLEKLFQVMVAVPMPSPKGVKEAVRAQLKAHGVPDDAECAAMIVEILEPNPRKIKNFVNGVCAAWCLYRQAAASPAGDNEEQQQAFVRQLVLFHYLRCFHKPVWRLLERQRWVLRVLHRVLNCAGPIDLELPEEEHIDDADVRILEELLFRCFAHVLQDTAEEPQPQMHRHLPLAQAVDLLNQRLDRKRSDDQFRRHFLKRITANTDLPESVLHLPPELEQEAEPEQKHDG